MLSEVVSNALFNRQLAVQVRQLGVPSPESVEKAEEAANVAWYNLVHKAANRDYPLYGYGFPPPPGEQMATYNRGTLLMTWNPSQA